MPKVAYHWSSASSAEERTLSEAAQAAGLSVRFDGAQRRAGGEFITFTSGRLELARHRSVAAALRWLRGDQHDN